MSSKLSIVPALCLIAALNGFVQAEDFETVSIHFEQNATDKDVEAVFEATGGDEGLASIKVVAPGGRTVINFTAPDSKLGLRSFKFESPEPKNDGTLQADLPEGEYTFTGTTVAGVKLRGTAKLSHKLPAATSVVRPAPNEKGVPVQGLKVAWTPVKNVRGYIVSIEQEESGFALTVNVPEAATSFAVPDGLLQAKTIYKLAIGTVSPEGNTSFIETSFTTDGQKPLGGGR